MVAIQEAEDQNNFDCGYKTCLNNIHAFMRHGITVQEARLIEGLISFLVKEENLAKNLGL